MTPHNLDGPSEEVVPSIMLFMIVTMLTTGQIALIPAPMYMRITALLTDCGGRGRSGGWGGHGQVPTCPSGMADTRDALVCEDSTGKQRTDKYYSSLRLPFRYRNRQARLTRRHQAFSSLLPIPTVPGQRPTCAAFCQDREHRAGDKHTFPGGRRSGPASHRSPTARTPSYDLRRARERPAQYLGTSCARSAAALARRHVAHAVHALQIHEA